MTSVAVFVGPTLPRAIAEAELDATFLPPASQGDVYRVARERPFAIGIIDGYFERVPAVWHKEILWAIAQGIHVFGASSMGALRAAELARFGMQGVGKIYEAFRSGQLEDDDEVTLAHGDASTGYRATSDAMVNVRATLRAAVASGVLGPSSSQTLVALAKSLFYPERTYRHLLDHGVAGGVPAAEIAALRDFLPSGRVDQKRADALELLAALRSCRALGLPPPAPKFAFVSTDRWERLVESVEAMPPVALDERAVADAWIAAEARLDSSAATLLAGAFVRAAGQSSRHARSSAASGDTVGSDTANSGGPTPPAHASPRPHERMNGATLEAWLEASGLDDRTYALFVERQAEVERFRHELALDLDRHVADEARWTDVYPRLSERARRKRDALARAGLTSPTLADAGLTSKELVAWYFEFCLQRADPRSPAIAAWSLGLPDAAALELEALREYFFRRFAANLGEVGEHGRPSRDIER